MKHTGTGHDSGKESGHDAARERAALYALGALSQHEARSFEEHLSDGCPSCAADLNDFGRVVEALALGAPPVDPPPGAREKLLARISRGGNETPHGDTGKNARADAQETSPDAAPAPAPPLSLAGPDFLVVRSDEGKWMKTPDEGVFVKLLFVDKDRDTVTTLVRMEPGARIPRHRHRGVEQCLVLEGDVRSGPYAMTAGDFNCSLRGSVHDELTTDHGALLFLVSPETYELLEHHQ